MSRIAKGIGHLLGWAFSLGFTLIIIGGIVAFLLFEHYSQDLPEYSQLASYEPPNLSRLYTSDGRLLAEYATQKRIFVPLKAVPKHVINAFISAEDKNFYEHTGIDLTGIARAVRDNVVNYGTGRSLVGGSTITQQVVKNFLLSSEKSLERKAKEAILAIRISSVYSKDKILELYLNEIYLGMGSYGVASAALNYYNKPLEALTIEEAALLAAQPKAPRLYDPRRKPERAFERRNWVIERMQADGHITAEEALIAKETPIVLQQRDPDQVVNAEFFAEEVRRQLVQKYGADVLYKGGLVVKTTIRPTLQRYADNALRTALIDYDRRRGYRGPFSKMAKDKDAKEALVKLTNDNTFLLLEGQKLAVVTKLEAAQAQIMFADGSKGVIPQAWLAWTRRVISDGVLGPAINKPADILDVNDVVLVGKPDEELVKKLGKKAPKNGWDLQQVPEVNGGMVVLDPHTGRVLAMSGGYAYGKTQFNRVTQARRQPGSAFKPFVYMAGLENGFTPATIIHDGEVEIPTGNPGEVWRPKNYGGGFLGDITMRVGLEKSRNTVTVQLARMIGLDKVLGIAKRFNIYPDPPAHLSIVLGSEETTLIRLVNAYGMIVNGGKAIIPSLIERIDDRHGTTIYKRDGRSCEGCELADFNAVSQTALPPMLEDNREQVVDERVAYQMVSMLKGVVDRGTAVRAKQIGKIVAGKTGTTNDSKDAWFIGFSPDLVAGVYIGYDNPRTLGRKETGSSVALPAYIDFMKQALANTPNQPFRVPRGLRLMKVSLKTGWPITGFEEPGERIITESFITGRPIYIPGLTSNNSWTVIENDPYDPAQPTQNRYNSTYGSEEEYFQNEGEVPRYVPQRFDNLPKRDEAEPALGTGGLY